MLSNQTAVATAERDQSANLAALDTAIGRLQAAGETGSPGSGKTGTGAPRSGQSGQLTGQTGAPSGTGAAGSRTPGTATGSGTGIGTAGGIGTGADSSGRGGSSSRTGTPTTASGNQVGGAGTGGSPTGQGQGGGQGGGQKGGGNNAAPKIATAADIAADQAQLDLDEADIAVARQNLTEASLTSPIVGTVAAVGISKGESVNANSTSQTITVLGPGQYKVSTTIGLSLIDQLKVGDTARVTVNGVLTPLTGKVTMIGVLSDSSSSGSTTYPVTVLLDPSAQSLYEGSGASVAITLSQVSNVLTVPTSAVHTTGSVHTVSVVENGTARTVVVQVGAVGVDLTEITSGVTAGQQVVIADLDQPLATSSVASRAGFGGVGGAGLGGAGGAPPGGGRLVRPGG